MAQRRRCASAMRAFPAAVRGPVESPPWNRQRSFPGSRRTAQGSPRLFLAPHLIVLNGYDIPLSLLWLNFLATDKASTWGRISEHLDSMLQQKRPLDAVER